MTKSLNQNTSTPKFIRGLRLLAFTALVAVLAVSAEPMRVAHAATFVIDTLVDSTASAFQRCTSAPNDCSLRGAILKAESTPEMDVITLPGGTYKLSSSLGPLRIRSSLFLNGAGQGKTFIDGNDKSQVLYILAETGSPIVNIHDVTIEKGRGGSGVQGGGIFVDKGAYLGLYDSTVRNSGSNGPGGGIANGGTVQLTRSTVSGNKAPIVGGPELGGVQHSGGGIMNFSGASLKIDSSTIDHNTASRGGGIRNAGGRMEITNSTISGNTAFARGGGIMNFGTAHIAFSTITLNVANTFRGSCETDAVREQKLTCGGGIYNDGTVSIANTILAKNEDNRNPIQSGSSPDCFSPVMFSFTSERGNLVGILSPNCNMRDVIWGDQRFDKVGTPEEPLDPKLGPLTNNGGPTATHALLTGSPAIDNAQFGSASPLSECPHTDQRGFKRPAGYHCDIGAYEFGAQPASQ